MGEKLKTKDKILTVATEIFYNKGFNGARMQEIANLANVNKAALHYYFSSKQELFEVVLLNSFKNLFISFDKVVNSNMPIIEKIDVIIEKYLDFIKTNTQNIKFILNEIENNLAFIQKNMETNSMKVKFFDEIFEELHLEMEKGTIKKINPNHLLINIISMCIFPFIAKPLIMEITQFSQEEIQHFFDEQENFIKKFVHNALQQKRE
ncbi:MAG: TetR/AcrR family transcriptional regulator [Candidatus Cloacimonetes bacterium]|nr:TetR/AcrR family transcriptional regulator [Candidatus Cloacimonadota bacterium]